MIKTENNEKINPKIRLLKPKIDVVFHSLFREDNKHLTEAFISAMLRTKSKNKEYKFR